MKLLIIKLGASGDVIRTTTLLHLFSDEIHWLTSDNNTVLLNDIPQIQRCLPWSKRESLKDEEYDLVVNLEDSTDTAEFLNHISFNDLYGAYLGSSKNLIYTENAKAWFDLSIISNYGLKMADELKLNNRKTYQEMIFRGLGYKFNGEKYFLPKPTQSDLSGDIAIAPKAGSVWPMKNWAYYHELKLQLEKDGFQVNFLPTRDTLLEHISDVNNHKYLISGDTLPMHIALGYGIKCLTIFTCTSPWEIYDYGVQQKIISPSLDEFFYQRNFDPRATTSISLDKVYQAVINHY